MSALVGYKPFHTTIVVVKEILGKINFEKLKNEKLPIMQRVMTF